MIGPTAPTEGKLIVIVCALWVIPLSVSAQETFPARTATTDVDHRAGDISISNFVSGPVCHDEEGTEEICEQAVDIDIRGESLCNWSGEERRCTWFGFQFDYENADPTISIVCNYTRSLPSREGNWESVRQENATEGTFSLDLEAASGHFFNPSYELYNVPPDGSTVVVTTEIECTYDGQPLFATTFRSRFSGRW